MQWWDELIICYLCFWFWLLNQINHCLSIMIQFIFNQFAMNLHTPCIYNNTEMKSAYMTGWHYMTLKLLDVSFGDN